MLSCTFESHTSPLWVQLEQMCEQKQPKITSMNELTAIVTMEITMYAGWLSVIRRRGLHRQWQLAGTCESPLGAKICCVL